MDMHHFYNLKCLSVFVRGEFEEGDVVCTTWTMVTIAIGCVVFLVASILVVCVLCIHSQRKRKQQPEIGLCQLFIPITLKNNLSIKYLLNFYNFTYSL